MSSLGVALEELRARLVSTKRKTIISAPEEPTKAYMELVFAIGFARLGVPARARELVEVASKDLGAMVEASAVHTHVLSIGIDRVERALEGAPDANWPPALFDAVTATEAVERYKILRLVEHLPWLRPRGFAVDAATVLRQGQMPRQPQQLPLVIELERASPDQRVAQLDTVLEARDLSVAAIMASFDALRTLAEDRAMPLLARAISRIDDIPEQSVELYAEALELLAHFRWGELAGPLVEVIAPLIAERHDADVVQQVTRVLRALRRLGLRDELFSLIPQQGFDPTNLAAGEPALMLTYAGALEFVGEPRGRVFIERAVADFERARNRIAISELRQFDALINGYTCSAVPYGLEPIRKFRFPVPLPYSLFVRASA